MRKLKQFSFGSLAALALCGAARAQISTTTETGPDGVTYQVTRNVVQRSIPTTEYQAQQQQVYHPQPTIQYQAYAQNYSVPVTEYQWVSRLHNWWNPFDGPYYSYELRPTTRWETRPGTVQIPVARTDWIQETRTVQVPVTTYRTVPEEYTSRVAVSVSPGGSSVAMRPSGSAYGGQQLQGDPPRAPATSYR